MTGAMSNGSADAFLSGLQVGYPRTPIVDPMVGFRTADTIERRRVEWAWDQRIPTAEVVGLAADGGTGKSTVAQDLAARVTRGELGRLPGGGTGSEPRGVVLLTVEEDPEAVVRPRLEAMGADLSRVLILSDSSDEPAPPLTLPSGADRLAAAARHVDAGLIIIDTGPGFLDGGLKSNSEEDVRAFYRPLAQIARDQRLVVLVIAHLNKSQGAARHRVTGSAAWVNVPRSVLIMGPPPGHDALETPERLVAVVKANLVSGRMPEAVALRLTSAPDDPSVAVIQWGEETAGIRAGDLTASVDAEEQNERNECADALVDLLAGGARTAKECAAALQAVGYTRATIRRARESLYITRAAGNVYQDGFRGPWTWRLPTDAHAGATDEHADNETDVRGSPVCVPEHLCTSVSTRAHGCSPTTTDEHTQTPRARDTRGDTRATTLAEGDGYSIHRIPGDETHPAETGAP